MLNCWYIVTIFYDLQQVNAHGINEESHPILPVWIVFTIEVRKAVDRVSLSNMVDLLYHLFDLYPLQPLGSSTLEVGLDTNCKLR